MCSFTADLLDYDKLTAKQKRDLLKKLKGEKKALESQLDFVEESIKGVDKSIRVLERKM